MSDGRRNPWEEDEGDENNSEFLTDSSSLNTATLWDENSNRTLTQSQMQMETSNADLYLPELSFGFENSSEEPAAPAAFMEQGLDLSTPLADGNPGAAASNPVTEALNDLLSSEEASLRGLGRNLQTMLNGNAEQRVLAENLLGNWSLDYQQMQQFLNLQNSNNPAEQERARLIGSLLSSDNNSAAGRALLQGFNSSVASERDDAARFERMLRNPNQATQREQALTILNNVESPEQRHQMLELMDSLSNREAAKQLLQMLNNPEQAQAARDLLQNLASPHARDNTDAELTLNMLNNPEQQALARRIMDYHDPERRHHLLEMANNSQTEASAARVMDMLESGNPRTRRNAQALLDYYESTDQADRQAGRTLAAMLADPQRRQQAETLLQTLGQTDYMPAALDMLQNPNQRAASDQIMRMLSGNAQDVSAAQTYLHMRTWGTASGASAQERQGYERINAMLNNPAQQADAQTILHALRERPEQIQALLEHIHNPATAAAGREILSMLGNAEGRAGAQRLLDGLNNNRLRNARQILDAANTESMSGEDANRLVAMLNNPQQRELANRLLRGLSDPDQIHNALELQSRYPADANTLLNMLANSSQRENASTLLSQLNNPEHLHQMLQIMQNPERQGAGLDALMRQLRSSDTAPGVTNLLSALSNPATAPSANQVLDLMRSNPERARQILESANRPEDFRHLVEMTQNPEQRRLLDTLHNFAFSSDNSRQQAARNINELLGSSDPAAQADGRRLLSMLNNPAERDRAAALV
ncbi:MAG: hypothetical protein K2X27_18830, partial [Candidatus Obscuribacterales bacterium]|nr:hypothetical protein [Candidatus Obscuribacterales bacterium]